MRGTVNRSLKTISLLMILMLALTLCGCRGQKNSDTPEPSAQQDGKKINALSYDMDLDLDTESDRLKETVSLTFRNDTDTVCDKICIRNMMPDILDQAEADYQVANTGSKVTSVRLEGGSEDLKIKYKVHKTALMVDLGEKGRVEPGGTCTVVITMETGIPEIQDRIGVVRKEEGTLYTLSFCFPYLADNDGSTWNTDPYFSDGESRSNDLADYKAVLRMPSEYQVAATGTSVTHDGKTEITAENVRDFAIVACDFMDKDTFEIDGITVNCWYLKGGNVDEFRKVTRLVAEDSIRIYLDRIGPYPYDELDVTAALFGFGFGGMEYPGLIMDNASQYYDTSFYDPVTLADVVSHEIGHQWFYSAVGNCEYREAWLDEGFTTFLEQDIYGMTPSKSQDYLRELDSSYPTVEEKKAQTEADLKEGYDFYEGMYLDVPPNEFKGDRMYGTAEYYGGYSFLEHAKNIMGEEKFDQFLKELYSTYYMKTITSQDVLALIRKYDDSEEMNKLISAFFRNTGR